jgi:Skp family chaperone for outer membrane proteins
MKTRERLVIYGLLTALLVANAVLLLGRTGTPAYADPWTGPLAELDGLGPTESLTLVDESADGELVLQNVGARLAWSSAAYDRVYSVAYVYIGTVLRQLMNSEEFVEDREHLVTELNERETKFRQQLDELGSRGQDLEPDSPEFRTAYDEYVALREAYGAWQQEAMARRGKLDAQHLESAYRQLVDAVEVVADRKGIDTVYRFIPTDEDFKAENPEAAMLAIRLRTALRYPKELDITDDVLEELSLEVE